LNVDDLSVQMGIFARQFHQHKFLGIAFGQLGRIPEWQKSKNVRQGYEMSLTDTCWCLCRKLVSEKVNVLADIVLASKEEKRRQNER
jgi:hypothetical protein